MTYYDKTNKNTEENEPDLIIDLHGYNTLEAEEILNEVLYKNKYAHIRIIVGKGRNSEYGPILPNFVKGLLKQNNISFEQASFRNGGVGALDVYLK